MSPTPPPLPAIPRPPVVAATGELQQRLNLLSVFHFLHAGFSMFLLAIPLYLLFFGIVAVSANTSDTPGITVGGWVMLVFSIVFGALILAFIGAVVVAGVNLRGHRRYGFCFAMAVIQCLHVPWGTLLGIFTILALNKPEAKQLFGVTSAGAIAVNGLK